MMLPPNEGGDFKPVPAGTHMALCYRVIDLGTQTVQWQGDIKHQRKALLSWELPTEPMEDGRPFTISQRYTLSSHEKANLRRDLESWRGKRFTEADFGPGGFDIKNVLGVPCLLGVIHAEKNGKTYANIASISAPPKGMDIPKGANDHVYFSLETDQFSAGVYESLSSGIRNVIAQSPEYQALLTTTDEPPAQDAPDARTDDFEDSEIPF